MPGPRGLVQRLDQAWHRVAVLPRNTKLLLAVSGGADSVALLRLLVAINRSNYWRWKLVVGHVDHGLRGRESRGDARFVRALAKTLGLPYVEKRLHLRATLKSPCSEGVARQARLRALRQMQQSKKCAGVVMAHHADDQAETILMRMFRGCGLEGLAGMNQSDSVGGMPVYRPLLDVRRQELRAYLHSLGQDWREDQSNASELYLRNRVRRNLMPLLEILWPKAVGALGRLAILASEAQGYLVEAAERHLMEYPSTLCRGRLEIPREVFWKAPSSLASEILRRVIAQAGGSPETADFERVREALRLIKNGQGGKRIEMGCGVIIELTGGAKGTIRVVRKTTP